MTEPLRQPLEAIEAIPAQRLRIVLAMCTRGHAYYRSVWPAADIDITTIRTVDDLQRLPLTAGLSCAAPHRAVQPVWATGMRYDGSANSNKARGD